MMSPMVLSVVISVLSEVVVYGLLYILLHVVEVLFPAEKGQSLRGVLWNIVITFCYFVIGYAILEIIRPWLPNEPLFMLPETHLWQQALYLLVYVFLFDVIFYWYHRAEHTIPALWAIHVLHHSDTALNVSSSRRSHWLELPLQALIIGVPTVLIFGHEYAFLVYAGLAVLVWEVFAHMNVRLQLSFLTPVLCGPQVHRIHHSILPEHRDKNFAQFFPFIDILFGTYYAPSRGEFPPTGAHNMPANPSLSTILLHPFREWFSRK